jgi:hypothetical protein
VQSQGSLSTLWPNLAQEAGSEWCRYLKIRSAWLNFARMWSDMPCTLVAWRGFYIKSCQMTFYFGLIAAIKLFFIFGSLT